MWEFQDDSVFRKAVKPPRKKFFEFFTPLNWRGIFSYSVEMLYYDKDPERIKKLLTFYEDVILKRYV